MSFNPVSALLMGHRHEHHLKRPSAQPAWDCLLFSVTENKHAGNHERNVFIFVVRLQLHHAMCVLYGVCGIGCVYRCVCVSVCEKERERQREQESVKVIFIEDMSVPPITTYIIPVS